MATKEHIRTVVKKTVDGYSNNEVIVGADCNIYGDNNISLGRLEESEIGENSVAIGQEVSASGRCSHAEGRFTTASGVASHAEGHNSCAVGNYSHTSGIGVIAEGEGQQVFGKYNLPNKTDIFQIGCGYDGRRENALVINQDGKLDGYAIKELFNKIYPIGALYLTTKKENPANIFGGTWVIYGQNKYLKGAGSSDNLSDGGRTSVTLTKDNLPAHSHTATQTAHSHWMHPENCEPLIVNRNGDNWITPYVTQAASGNRVFAFGSNTGLYLDNPQTASSTPAITVSDTGSGKSFELNPSYITIYIWRRTTLA